MTIKHNVSLSSEPWDFLLMEATRQLQQKEALCARLRVAIEHYQRQKDSGAKFPGIERIQEEAILPTKEELSA